MIGAAVVTRYLSNGPPSRHAAGASRRPCGLQAGGRRTVGRRHSQDAVSVGWAWGKSQSDRRRLAPSSSTSSLELGKRLSRWSSRHAVGKERTGDVYLSKAANRTIEIDPAYVDVAVQRWQAFAGEVARLESNSRSFVETKEDRTQKPADTSARSHAYSESEV